MFAVFFALQVPIFYLHLFFGSVAELNTYHIISTSGSLYI